MTTTVIVPTIKRPITPTLFADLTDIEWSYEKNVVNEYVITFADDLPITMPPFIVARCVQSPAEEDAINYLHAARAKIRANDFSQADLATMIDNLVIVLLRDF